MLNESHTIKVAPDSELARLLEEAGDTPLLLEKDGTLYRLSREDENLWAGYDAEKVRAAIAQTAGSWADVDTDQVIAALYRARETGARPTTRP